MLRSFKIAVALSLLVYCICEIPQPMREGGKYGGTDPGPRNIEIDKQNPDQLVPPKTDHGKVPNMKFSFSYAHLRLETGGWTREVTVRDLPIAKSLAGVNMRLKAGGVRELHWHVEAEWGYVLYGRCQITAVDHDGRNFIDDVSVGDLWYFPAGIPHSIQGLEDDGCEFLLVFDDGGFSEDSTFLLTDWITHTPTEVLAKNFDFPEDAFKNTSATELYIFASEVPDVISRDQVTSPQGKVKQWYSFKKSKQHTKRFNKGKVTIVDSSDFKISTTVASALVELEPGGLREMHWHPNADEWLYIIEGHGRMTVFAAETKARTFDFGPGDVGYIPKSQGHYIEVC